jgi:hypothetical protein
MKPRIGVYLSEHTAARLAAAAKRPGATKSALVEAALDRFLGSEDDIVDSAAVTRRLASMSRQLEHLDRDLKTVNETVALHARFHLAVTPVLPAAAQPGACALGSERFDEFAAQVGRRVYQGTSLMRETMDRLSATKPNLFANDREEGASGAHSTVREPEIRASTAGDDVPERFAAVREDGSDGCFPEQSGNSMH